MLSTYYPFKIKDCAALLRDEATLAFPLMVILAAAYDDLFEVDSVELYARIEEDFRAELPIEAENRIQAAILGITTDMFYDDALSTRSISMAFYEGDLGDLVNGVLETVYLPEILWTAYELGLMREDDEDFSPEVDRFIDELVADAAEELEMEDDSVLPYYAKTLMDQKLELKEQLAVLGKTINDGIV